MRLAILLILLLIAFPVGLVAQPVESTSLTSEWRLRAENFTAKAIDASSRLKSLNKALVYARLADIWWPVDRDKAGQFYENAVYGIFFLTSDEINADRQAVIDASGKILVLIANRDPKQSKRLVSIVKDARGNSAEENKLNADALIGFAKELVKDNPEVAVEMGILALQVGQPSIIYELYWSLCRKDRPLAAKLFDAMLRSAIASPTILMANNIKLAAFPELSIPNVPDEIKSTATQKTRALEFLVSYLVGQRNKFDTKQIQSCANDASLVSPLLPQFAVFIPAQHGIATATVDHCLRGTTSNSRPDAQLEDPSQVTVEALLRLAEKAEMDSSERSYYLFRAASLANDQQKFEQAIKILDGMSEVEIGSDSDFWDSLRYTVAAGLSYKKVEESDFPGASSVLEKVPESISAFARIGLGLKCSSSELTVQQFCASQLDTGVLELPKSTKGVGKKARFAMYAVQRLAKFGHPSEALQAIETVVKLVNNENSENKKIQFHLDQEMFDGAIDADFLKSYAQSISSEIENLSDPESKVNGLISLVATSVNRAAKAAKGSRGN